MINNDFTPILKGTRPLRPYHQSNMDMIYKNNINESFSFILKNTWPSELVYKI